MMCTDKNQNTEQIARDKIDTMLREAGWLVQSKNEVDLGASRGVADYVIFVNRKPVGIIEAKKEDKDHELTATGD
jgi:type I restriction enzyme R subunit